MGTVIITGGSRGIGLGLAREFLKNNWNTVICGRDEKSLANAEKELKSISNNILAVSCDVTQIDQVENLYKSSKEKFGSVEIWINNAGIANKKTEFWTIPAADLHKVVNINLNGLINGCRTAINEMLKQGFGTVYNFEGFGSDGRKIEGLHTYGATKRAVRYLTKSLQLELKNKPVTIGTLSPGMVTTDLLLRDLEEMNEVERKRTIKFYNILADKVETVTPFLVKKMINNRKKKPAIAWLTGGKAFRRFLTAGFKKRKIVE